MCFTAFAAKTLPLLADLQKEIYQALVAGTLEMSDLLSWFYGKRTVANFHCLSLHFYMPNKMVVLNSGPRHQASPGLDGGQLPGRGGPRTPRPEHAAAGDLVAYSCIDHRIYGCIILWCTFRLHHPMVHFPAASAELTAA